MKTFRPWFLPILLVLAFRPFPAGAAGADHNLSGGGRAGSTGALAAAPRLSPEAVLSGLQRFYAKTSRADGSFSPGMDPAYRGLSDSAYSDLAAVTYAVTMPKTFCWKLPREEQTI